MYGIPEFKLEKKIVDRRVKLMEAEGIKFQTNANVGFNVKVEDLRRDFDAIFLCGGAAQPPELPAPRPGLEGVPFPLAFPPPQNTLNQPGKILPPPSYPAPRRPPTPRRLAATP